MNIRDIRQEEAANSWFYSERKSMINSCPRFGKIKTSILIMQKIQAKKVLCAAPRIEVIKSWKSDLEKWGFEIDIEYVTHTSIDKYKDWKGDLFIIDEPHELSLNEIRKAKQIVNNNPVLALDGTVTKKTRNKLEEELGISTCYRYSINKGVEEGILCDYNITIHLVDLDNKTRYIDSKKGLLTEKVRFDQLLYVKNKMEEENKSYFHIDLKIISLLQNSIAKKQKTIELLNQSKNERVLVFCGSTNIADSLNIPTYHSKSKEKKVFEDFCNGLGTHLATIKMMDSGVTILPISKGLINYTSGSPEETGQKLCRFLGIEYNTPNKKADLHIICSDTDFEKSRIKTALLFFDENKITWKKENLK